MGEKAGPETVRIMAELKCFFPNAKDEQLRGASQYVLTESNKSYAHDTKNGIKLGRADAVRMLESVMAEYTTTEDNGETITIVPGIELRAIIKALKKEG